MDTQYIRMNKKALSSVIAIFLITLLTITAATIIWNVVNKSVDEGLAEAKSCYDLIGKVSIDSKYTCYDSTNDEMRVFITVGDIELEELIIVVSGDTFGNTYVLTDEVSLIENIEYSSGDLVKLPEKNSGETYVIAGVDEEPLSIEIAPKLEGKLCEGDKFTAIGECSQLIPN